MAMIKDKRSELHSFVEDFGRAISIAKSKIEESAMRAVKHVWSRRAVDLSTLTRLVRLKGV